MILIDNAQKAPRPDTEMGRGKFKVPLQRTPAVLFSFDKASGTIQLISCEYLARQN